MEGWKADAQCGEFCIMPLSYISTPYVEHLKSVCAGYNVQRICKLLLGHVLLRLSEAGVATTVTVMIGARWPLLMQAGAYVCAHLGTEHVSRAGGDLEVYVEQCWTSTDIGRC
jgi:hypothetical protein